MIKRIKTIYPHIKDLYIIYEDGTIINEKTKNQLTLSLANDGYLKVSLMLEKGRTTKLSIHRLKMMAFRPTVNMETLQINHKDGNKCNNDYDNLEWVTAKENIQHAWRTNLASSKNIQGEKTNLAHYTEEDAKKVIELLKTNNFTDKEISDQTGLPVKSFIAKIRRKETWKYLTKDIVTPLGKPERKYNFSYK